MTDLLHIKDDSPFPSFVNGEVMKTKATFPVFDPHDRTRVLHQVYGVDAEEAGIAVEAAADALFEWRNSMIQVRRNIFIKAADILRTRAAEFVKLQVEETTISQSFAALNVMLTVSCLEELAAAATVALAGQVVACDFPGQTAHVSREPYGVVLGITPWNAPLVLAARAAANPIIGGNTVVLKTSELSPLSNTIIAQVFAEAGLPKGVLNVVHVSAEATPKVVESIIANPLVRKVNFTGSTRVGSIVGALCGRYIKPSVLELGGAAVFVVLEDADLELAAKNAIYGSFLHSGQICMSTNNVLVHESVADKFIQTLQRQMQDVRAGPSSDPEDNLLRGVFSDGHASRVNGLIIDAISKGAKVVVGDPATAGKHSGGNVIQPIVLDGLSHDMQIHSEEIFGPVMGIIRFSSDAEAVRLANKLEYGLSGAVHSQDLARATRVAKQLEINLVHINTFTLHDNAMVPHGGWKNSGYGRFNGFEGIREFTQTKCISYVDQSLAPPVPTL